MNQPALVTVKDVYGDLHRIDAHMLYMTTRNQLSLYTKTGIKLSEHRAQMNWPMGCTTIHRANIQEIL